MLAYGGRPVLGFGFGEAVLVPSAPAPAPEHPDWGLVFGSGAAAATIVALFLWGLRAAGPAR